MSTNSSSSAMHHVEIEKPLYPQTDGEPLLTYPWSTSEVTSMPVLFEERRKRAFQQVKAWKWLDWLYFFIPCLRWLRTYDLKKCLIFDLIAGISIGAMVIPQGMSYANTAGLPSVFGLYGAFVPNLVYSIFGSSRQLAVGPVAVTSSLLSSQLSGIIPGFNAITNHNSPGALQNIQNQYNTAAVQIAFIVSIMYTLLGILHLGFLTNFLSHSVIGGFTSGAAVYIGAGQLKYILGYSSLSQPAHQTVQDIFSSLITEFDNFLWEEFIMGTTMLVYLISLKEIARLWPRYWWWLRPFGPVSACIIAISAVVIGNLSTLNIKIIASIPQGAPPVTVDWWFPMTNPDFSQLFPIAIVIMLVDVLESTSIARALARKNNYAISWNQEIVALGLANFAGSCFSCYTTTGSFSRSSVNNAAGAKTILSAFICSMVVLFALLFLTQVFDNMPYNTMAAIVIAGVTDLFEYEQAIYLYKVNKLDFMVWWASFFGTIFYSVELGLGIAVGMAVLITIYESAFPNIVVLGRIPGTSVYRNRKQYREAQIVPGILGVRVDASIYFANVNWLRERFERFITRAAEIYATKGMRTQFFILDASPVTHVDATGAKTLEDVIVDLAKMGIQFVLVNPSPKVLHALEKAAITELFGREWIFVRMHDAFSYCKSQLVNEEGGAYAVQPSMSGLMAVPPMDEKIPPQIV